MRTFLLIIALALPAAAQIGDLMKQGANVTLKDQALVYEPVKIEPCSLVWQIKHKAFTREITVDLADLDAKRFRIEPVKDQSTIMQLVFSTLSDREVIREQTIYPDNSRTDLSHKSRHVLLIRNRPIANQLKQALASVTTKCIAEQNPGQ